LVLHQAKVERRGLVTPAEALVGIPMRWILLGRLAKMHREQANSDSNLVLDVAGIAEQTAVELEVVRVCSQNFSTKG
jgi:hypothetical protein